jgi:hypothetical protein
MRKKNKETEKKHEPIQRPTVNEYKKEYLKERCSLLERSSVRLFIIQLKFVEAPYSNPYYQRPYNVFYRINPYHPIWYFLIFIAIFKPLITFKLDYKGFFLNLKTIFDYEED